MFKEAKSAYLERKAEVVAGRQIEREEKRLRRLKLQETDNRSVASSRRSSRSKRDGQSPRSDHKSTRSSAPGPRSPTSRLSPGTRGYSDSQIRDEREGHDIPKRPQELQRRHTEQPGDLIVPPSPRRTMTSPSKIDMDLAYGDIPPPLPVARLEDEDELKGLVGKVKLILEEADCLQYSATAIIASLQSNPDAMAAVALTLAEISSIVSKMAPGALAVLKGSSPAVFALLASPQFLVAAGVGVGVTIVALGGYKIIKKIKAKNSMEEPGMDEMLELKGDVSRIDTWRRGIAEAEAQSVGTSIDGEFITPHAAALSRLNLNDGESKASRRKHRSSRSTKDSETASSKMSNSSRKTSKTVKSSKEKREGKEIREKKEKKPSSLSRMFS